MRRCEADQALEVEDAAPARGRGLAVPQDRHHLPPSTRHRRVSTSLRCETLRRRRESRGTWISSTFWPAETSRTWGSCPSEPQNVSWCVIRGRPSLARARAKARGAGSAMARCSARHAIVPHPPGGKSVGGWARAKRGVPGTGLLLSRLLCDGDQLAIDVLERRAEVLINGLRP